MGSFGDSHGDRGDCQGFFTSMISNSDLPKGYDPGRFFCLFLGVYVVLHKHSTFTFSGRQAHGATPPTSPTGEQPLPHALRSTLVFYPPASMLLGEAKYVFGSAEGRDPIYMTPEITNVK